MTTRKENSVMFALAEVVDIERARARRHEAACREKEEQERIARAEAERQARLEEELRRKEEVAAKARRQETEARMELLVRQQENREQRFQKRVQDRLARIEAEGALEVARLRLEYARRPEPIGRKRWVVPSVVCTLVALVALVGYLAGVGMTENPDVATHHTAAAHSASADSDGTYGTLRAGLGREEVARANAEAAAPAPVAKPRPVRWQPRRPRLHGNAVATTTRPKPPVKICGRLGALACIND
ncbi:MAG: hypothetical protein ABI333_20215 [bacterium]